MITGALPQVSEYDEIAIYTVPYNDPCFEGELEASPERPGGRTARYDGWIYSGIALPVPIGELIFPGTRAAPPLQMGGLPLVGHEEMIIRWRSYAEYLSMFYSGKDALLALRELLYDSLSSGLRGLLQEPPPAGSRLRLWWVNDPPELEDVPWELLAHGQSPPPRISIVRGRPPVSVPPLPLSPGRPLTLAVFDPAGLAPAPLREALGDLGSSVKIVRLISEDPREALDQAVRAGVEMVHLVADGSVPLGVEGLLDFPGGATLTPTEACQILRGSRVEILSLSAPSEPLVDHEGLPTVFHGFARFGRAFTESVTIVAQLAPIAPSELGRFWRAFYQRFAEALDVENALAVATPCPLMVPVVLFLRHRFGHQFTRAVVDPDDVSFDPGAPADLASSAPLSDELAVSGKLLDAAVSLQERYAALGLVFPGQDVIDKARVRQHALASYIDDALIRGKVR